MYGLRIAVFSFIWTELYFALVAITVFFWTRFVIIYVNDRNAFAGILKYAGIVFLAFEFLALLVNLFLPVMFYFDEEGIYHTGKARAITMFAQILLFLATSIYMLAVALWNRGKIRRRHGAIAGFGISMTVFVLFSTLYPTLPFYSLGYLLGVCIIHTFVLEDEKESRRRELESLLKVGEIQEQELDSARLMAYTDPLTFVKSKTAYQEDIIGIEKRIEGEILKDFGLAVFDVNGLKSVNDTKGHEEGDRLIKSACKIICEIFKHSPIYRIGGDEFVAFIMGDDYRNRVSLLYEFNLQMEKNAEENGIVVACGFSEYAQGVDRDFSSVFNRADKKMYEQKKKLKKMKP